MLEVVPSETLAALAGVMPRGSNASANAAVPAMERLMRLVWGTTTWVGGILKTYVTFAFLGGH